MYARLAQATGWTWEYIGQNMTLPRLYAFTKMWADTPPLAESVAALAFGFGVLKKRTPALAEGSPEHEQALAEFIGELPTRTRQRPA